MAAKNYSRIDHFVNSGWYIALQRFGYLLLLNILFCLVAALSCLILFFPGLTSLETIAHKMINDEEVSPIKDFFLEIKKQWSYMWRLELLGMGVIAFFGLAIYGYALYLYHYGGDWIVYVSGSFLAALALIVLSLFFVLQLYNTYFYTDTFGMMIRKSGLIARRKIFFTLGNVAIFASFFVVNYFLPYVIPFFSFAFCAYAIEALNHKLFSNLAREEEENLVKEGNTFLPAIMEGKTMKNVLVVGSANMDYTVYLNKAPEAGETVSGITRKTAPGGKGANQAIACLRAGAPTSFLTSLGGDADGKALEGLFSSLGLHTIIKRSKKETGNATIIVESSGENRIIVIPGANGDLVAKDIKEEALEGVNILVLQNEIPQETNDFILKKYGSTREVVYNPAPARAISDESLKAISYFIVNETELSYYGHGDTVEEKAKSLLEKGVKNVLVTLGIKGSRLYSQEGLVETDCCHVKAVDTVGAGDTYLGYFVYGLASNMDKKEAMALASRASAIAVTRLGAIPAIPTKEEVENFKF